MASVAVFTLFIFVLAQFAQIIPSTKNHRRHKNHPPAVAALAAFFLRTIRWSRRLGVLLRIVALWCAAHLSR